MSQKPWILLIDDSQEMVDGLKKFLSRKYEVLTALNGLDAIKQFERNENRLALVITDLVMPLISGVGVISMIKKKAPQLPIIAMTGWGRHPGALASEARADCVLNKPFDLRDLDKTVSRLLAAHAPRTLSGMLGSLLNAAN